MTPSWTHLIRFIAKEDGQIHLGQIDSSTHSDVGLAVYEGKEVEAKLVLGSVYDGTVSERTMHVKQVCPASNDSECGGKEERKKSIRRPDSDSLSQLLSPLAPHEVPIIRCMGLNYRDHAKEANMPIPDVPVLFIKPRTAVNGPFPATINVPKFAQDGSSDYEAELVVVIAKDGRDIAEEDALEYVLGYTCSNDVSARTQQFKNSQWCFSKGALLSNLGRA